MVSGRRAQTTQQAAAAIMTRKAGQEAGNRKKKAGHPVHLDQCVKSVTSRGASRFNAEYLIRGQTRCRSALKSPPRLKRVSICVFSPCVCVCVCLSVHLSSQFAFSALTLTLFSSLLHHPRHQILPSFSARRIKEKERNTRISI